MLSPNYHNILEYPKIQWFGGFKRKTKHHHHPAKETHPPKPTKPTNQKTHNNPQTKACREKIVWTLTQSSTAIGSLQGSNMALISELKRGNRQNSVTGTEHRDIAYSKCSFITEFIKTFQSSLQDLNQSSNTVIQLL